ncbi:MAG TPA: DnaD domain protein [Dehalococcoidales bacterium]
MNEFKGFPARMQYTAIPNIVFSAILPQINDLVELKVLFHVLAIIYLKKGAFRSVGLSELVNDAGLAFDLNDSPTYTSDKVSQALASLETKNVILHFVLTVNGHAQDWYCLNTEANKLTIQRIRQGEILGPETQDEKASRVIVEPPRDIFSLYEENIGMLTPLIAEELKEAEKNFPATWIGDAIKEAVTLNKRNWRYILRILENWSAQGKDSGTHRGNLKTATDPDKYIRGKYGHMVQR